MIKKTLWAATVLAGMLTCAAAQAEAPTAAPVATQRVTTLVEVARPPGATRAFIEEGFQRAVPTYQAIPGLIRKYFTVNEKSFGGMYLWTDRASAEAWYSPQWAAQCAARYHTECHVTYFDSPLQIEGKAAH